MRASSVRSSAWGPAVLSYIFVKPQTLGWRGGKVSGLVGAPRHHGKEFGGFPGTCCFGSCCWVLVLSRGINGRGIWWDGAIGKPLESSAQPSFPHHPFLLPWRLGFSENRIVLTELLGWNNFKSSLMSFFSFASLTGNQFYHLNLLVPKLCATAPRGAAVKTRGYHKIYYIFKGNRTILDSCGLPENC